MLMESVLVLITRLGGGLVSPLFKLPSTPLPGVGAGGGREQSVRGHLKVE